MLYYKQFYTISIILVCYSEDQAKECKNQSLYYFNNSCVGVQEYCSLAKLGAFNETHCINSSDTTASAIKSADGAIEKITASEDYFR